MNNLKWAAVGSVFTIAAWLVYPNSVGITEPDNKLRVSALCKDATFSYSTNRSGTCSGRGGVERWFE